MHLSIEDYHSIRDFIHNATGILFEDKKIYFVKKRLNKRIEDVGGESALAYLRLLKFGDPRGEELQAFINCLTTNETYFFREFNQLAVFAEYCLPEIYKKKQRLACRRLRIWSAGCSTGEEPYTLAIILREMLDDPDEWVLEVLATDIDTKVLRIAQQGLFDKRSVKDVPPEYLNNWFTITRKGQYRLHPVIKKMVRFERLNFINHLSMAEVSNVDFIFCRNVLIYFEQEVRKKVVDHLYNSMNSGGYIFLGHSESMSRISSLFNSKRMGGMITYQKKC